MRDLRNRVETPNGNWARDGAGAAEPSDRGTVRTLKALQNRAGGGPRTLGLPAVRERQRSCRRYFRDRAAAASAALLSIIDACVRNIEAALAEFLHATAALFRHLLRDLARSALVRTQIRHRRLRPRAPATRLSLAILQLQIPSKTPPHPRLLSPTSPPLLPLSVPRLSCRRRRSLMEGLASTRNSRLRSPPARSSAAPHPTR